MKKNSKIYLASAIVLLSLTFILVTRSKLIDIRDRQIRLENRLDSLYRAKAKKKPVIDHDKAVFLYFDPIVEHSEIVSYAKQD